MLIPHRFAIRCIDELGLILRNDIIWAKPNGMPESVTDRFSKKHEFIFFFVKNQKYYFDLDAIREQYNGSTLKRASQPNTISVTFKYSDDKFTAQMGTIDRAKLNEKGKNPGDVSDFWAITTKSNKTKHYATFNSELIDKPIMAGCPEGGIILDPFCGSGTTLVRGLQLGRNVIGIDGKEEYCKIAKERIEAVLSEPKFIS